MNEIQTPAAITATTARNVGLEQIAALLSRHQASAVDVVVPAPRLRSEGAQLVIEGAEPRLTDRGVVVADGHYRTTDVADAGLASKLGIPVSYLRRMKTEAPRMYDENVNGWLAHESSAGRSLLVRGLRTDDGGVARAVLSDRYRIVDNLDVLLAALEGVHAAGVEVEIDGCDLSERRMYVRISSEAVAVHAPALLANYRSPFSGARGTDNPVVFAGFELSNSEVGCGAYTLTPRIRVQVCTNGVTITKDAMREVHLGGQLESGTVRWSHDTHNKALALVKAKARDAVRTFLDVDYVRGVIEEIEQTAATPIDDPRKTIKTISTPLQWTADQQASILRHFIKGGDATAGGILHAVTSTAQTLANADAAHDMEAQGIKAMEIAATAASRA